MLTIEEFKVLFNAQAVLSPAEKGKMKLFQNIGAYCRKVAKNSMIDVNVGNDAKKIKARERKISKAGFIISGGERVSKPGAAAFSKTGLMKQHIYFAADENDVVIGPAALTGVRSKNAMEVLEHGGTEQIITGGRKKRIAVTAQYKARPTMGLALEVTKEKKLSKMLENFIGREA